MTNNCLKLMRKVAGGFFESIGNTVGGLVSDPSQTWQDIRQGNRNVADAMVNAGKSVYNYGKDVARGIKEDPNAFVQDLAANQKNVPRFINRSFEGAVDAIGSTPAMAYSYGIGLGNYLAGNGWKQGAVPEWSAAPAQYFRKKLAEKFPNVGINEAFTVDTGDANTDAIVDTIAHTGVGGVLGGIAVGSGLKHFNAPQRISKAVTYGTAAPSAPAPYTK